MNASEALTVSPLWQIATRLGESQILLPTLLCVLLALWMCAAAGMLARRWLLGVVLATVLTTASKLAFIGWGWGWAALDFTGFSGHAMYAAAIYPLLLACMLPWSLPRAPYIGMGAGCALAVLVGLSRVVIGVHSWSEVLSGLVLGGAVSLWAFAGIRAARPRLPPILPAILLVWIVVAPFQLPPTQTHSLVVRTALALSGAVAPHTRQALHE